MLYTFITDPGHAWLEVPLSDLKKYDIIKDISTYSYMTQTDAYLEEDCDARKFIIAADIDINSLEIGELSTDSPALCRNYMSYDPDEVKRILGG